VDAALGFGHRHPLYPVHAALVFQAGPHAGGPGSRCLDRHGRVLVPAEAGHGGVEYLRLPAPALRIAQVHAQQVAGEQGGLLAALPRLHLEDDVLAVAGIAGNEQVPQPLLEPGAALGDLLGLGRE